MVGVTQQRDEGEGQCRVAGVWPQRAVFVERNTAGDTQAWR